MKNDDQTREKGKTSKVVENRMSSGRKKKEKKFKSLVQFGYKRASEKEKEVLASDVSKENDMPRKELTIIIIMKK